VSEYSVRPLVVAAVVLWWGGGYSTLWGCSTTGHHQKEYAERTSEVIPVAVALSL